MSGKYDSLRDRLMAFRSPSVMMSFTEIEAILGAALPPSARSHREWWANETNPATRHVHCRSWQLAGYSAFPDMGAELVTFRRSAGS
jgi:hypothetical protein